MDLSANYLAAKDINYHVQIKPTAFNLRQQMSHIP